MSNDIGGNESLKIKNIAQFIHLGLIEWNLHFIMISSFDLKQSEKKSIFEILFSLHGHCVRCYMLKLSTAPAF